MKKIQWIIGIITMLVCSGVQAELVLLAGWDAGLQSAASTNTSDVAGTASWGVKDGTASWVNSAQRYDIDGTFGTLAANASLNNAAFSINTDPGRDGADSTNVYLEFTVVNHGTEAYTLDSFSFDVWRAEYHFPSKYTLSMTGDLGDVTDFDSGASTNQNAVPATSGSNYEDFDISLAGLPDRTLMPGESVTFHLEFQDTNGGNGSQLWVDNIAVLAVPEYSSNIVAGWDNGLQIASNTGASNITGTASWGVLDGTASWVNSEQRYDIDGTFGAFTTNASLNNAAFSINTDPGRDGADSTHVYLEFTVVNNGTEAYTLNSFSFDVWRAEYHFPSKYTLSMTGDLGNVTDFASGAPTNQNALPAASGSNYEDFDISLAGLPDRTLMPDKSVTFRLEFQDTNGGNGSQLWVDNIAITFLESGSLYESWAGHWGLHGTDADYTADLDSDGMNNLVEYALGGNPTNEDAITVLPVYPFVGNNGTNWFYYIHRERIDDPSLSYTVQQAADIVDGNWQTNGVDFVGESDVVNNFRLVTNRTEIGSERFIRLQIQKN